MPSFSPIITDFWRTYLRRGTILRDAVDFQLAVSPELHEDTELMMLQTVAGKTSAVVTPSLPIARDSMASRQFQTPSSGPGSTRPA